MDWEQVVYVDFFRLFARTSCVRVSVSPCIGDLYPLHSWTFAEWKSTEGSVPPT